MRAAIALLFLLWLLPVSNGLAAGPAIRIVVNCFPSLLPTGSAHCYDAVLGKPVTAYVVAGDANLAIATSYTGTVHLSSSDPTASLPPDHTFTAADAGIWQFQATFNSLITNNIPSLESITATDATNSFSSSQVWSVFPPVISAPTLGQYPTFILFCSLGIFGLLALRSRQRFQ